MRPTLFLLSLPLLAFAAPSSNKQGLTDRFQLQVENLKENVKGFVSGLDDDDDKCPDLKVRCVKDGDITKIVGDIGKQGFCRDGVECKQCHETKNTAECNLKYPKECATKCEAWGSPI
ncbi:hypothetical protein T439DRAFT_323092 [Meredithblackwellia eburnea MCA 4105]